ncbi:MAG: class I SAM-dependent methyltransferase [Pseudomonadota bacterium]
MKMNTQSDSQTLTFYDAEAETYAAKARPAEMPASFHRFAAALPSTAHVLDLGSGDGHYAAAFEAKGHHVTAMDGSAGLAAIASKRLVRPVRVARFDELADIDAFDGVWAHASLLHAPLDSLPDLIGRIHRSLRAQGIFHASFKTGQPEGRDKLGRYYNFPTQTDLQNAMARSGDWMDVTYDAGEGIGYDGTTTGWIILFARKTA